ncbi:MAG: cation diffusion facilitator family transporter [Candidatus Heimdallarchaeota archaeon]|nr:cation diffusion facilitator family transporter [Candidatus Heimdallarchaeota archaeon]MDH5646187.1 cation diffusion facilitator family transporter [Candidatus Heimdallarchaeota archaeon]
MAGASLVSALIVNFLIGAIKLVVFAITGSASMLAESYHSFADTFNQILLFVGIRRSKRKPDPTHPFGYAKEQFFWAFMVAILIFGISGTLAFKEGWEILKHPDSHTIDNSKFFWNLIVLGIAIILEGFALKTAYGEAKEYQKKYKASTLKEAIDEMQDPVLMSLLVEDSLALIGLVVAFIGVSITNATHNPLIDAYTSMAIGVILMFGGLLLARENKVYLVGRAVSSSIQSKIKTVVNNEKSIKKVISMKTLLLGVNNLIVALDIEFNEKVDEAEAIDIIEKNIIKEVPNLTPSRIFIEAQ